jgi:hypothetical protein
MANPKPNEPRKKQGDKFETLIDEAASDEAERKRRQSAGDDEDAVENVDDSDEDE